MIWFQTMLPTLMPFMILSTLMVSLHLVDFIGAKTYCVFMGFLCGFPMGAKVTRDLYHAKAFTKTDAQIMLAFCNNLGPVFLLNYAFPMIGIHKPLIYLLGLYGIPFIYGMVNLYIHRQNSSLITPQENISSKTTHLLYHIDDAIQCAIHSITTLGGYMILFNLLYIIPLEISGFPMIRHLNLKNLLPIRCFLEICGGLSQKPVQTLWLLSLLSFGGLSCLAQTYSVIKDSDLAYSNYLKHKLCMTLLTMAYFAFLSYAGFISLA